MAEEKTSLFSQEQLEQNVAYKRELIELICKGKAILFIGSGCTCQIDSEYLRWYDLIEELARIARDNGCDLLPDTDQDMLKYAHYIKEALKNKTGDNRKYYTKICEIYNPDNKNEPGELHKTLISLPVRTFVTTNYVP
jgi:hypothetical protein